MASARQSSASPARPGGRGAFAWLDGPERPYALDQGGLATDAAGNVYVAVRESNSTIEKFGPTSGGDDPPPPPPTSGDPFADLPANDLAFVCDTRKVAIQFLERKRRTARVDGLAASSLVGRTVELEVDGKKVAETVVEADGSFSGRVKLPRSEKAVRKARVTAQFHQISPSEPFCQGSPRFPEGDH